MFSHLTQDQLEGHAQNLSADPKARMPQRRLAFQWVRILHGEEAATRAGNASRVMLRREAFQLTETDPRIVKGEVPSSAIPAPAQWPVGLPEIMVESSWQRARQVPESESRREASRRMMRR
jgi:tyrosyl-tRNA synthetase